MKLKLISIIFLTLFSLHAKEVPQLTLSASATVQKPADELQLKIGVVTLSDTAEEALRENNEKMWTILKNLENAGLTSDDYETCQFSINPTYTPYPSNPPSNWRQTINGYEVTNSILIHTPKLDVVGKWIDLANQSGANKITDVRFGLHSSKNDWREAISLAGANALSDAEVLANATHVRLVRVLSISLNHTHMKSPSMDLACFSGANAATPITPGEVTIEANVTVVYEIE